MKGFGQGSLGSDTLISSGTQTCHPVTKSQGANYSVTQRFQCICWYLLTNIVQNLLTGDTAYQLDLACSGPVVQSILQSSQGFVESSSTYQIKSTAHFTSKKNSIAFVYKTSKNKMFY